MIRNSAWLLLDKVVRIGGGLALVVWLARTVGPEQFGAFSFASAILSVVAAAATLGLQSLLMRDVVRLEGRARERLLGIGLLLRLGASVLFVGIGIGIASVLRGGFDTSAYLAAILLLSVIAQSWDIYEWALLSQERARQVVQARVGVFVLCAILKALIIVFGARIDLFAAVFAVEAVAGAVVMRQLAWSQHLCARIGVIEPTQVARYAGLAAPLLVTTLAVQIYMRVDQIIIDRMLGSHAVGLYAAAVRISEAWNFIPTSVALAAAPRLTAAFRRSDVEFERQLERLVGLLAWISIAFLLAVIPMSSWIVTQLYGASYGPAAQILCIHVGCSVFVAMGVASGPFFVNHGLFKLSMVQTVAGALVNLALNLVLIPVAGLTGAALAAVVAMMLSTVGMNLLLPETRSLGRLQLRSLVSVWRLGTR